MGDFNTTTAAMNYPYYPPPDSAAMAYASMQPRQTEEGIVIPAKPNDPPPPPPVVICPSEVDHINITLEKNQQCQCKDCGKLFNSVWYLKQHAVKHSNDRPFKCKFCFKTYKFRSNLYQHKCPDRQKHLGQGKHYRNAKRMETNQLLKNRIEASMGAEDLAAYNAGSVSDNEENDIPITYGLLIHKFDDIPKESLPARVAEPTDADDKFIPPNCVREQQLKQTEIEHYITENKNRLHTCRKCRLLFPTEASLMRHAAAHNREDMFPYKCGNCRQAFESSRDLHRHAAVHTSAAPWKCDHCSGLFKSSPALRRHKDQCRACDLPQEQNDILVSVHSPLDPYSFIPGETDPNFLIPELNKPSPDSGVENSPENPQRPSPERNLLDHLVDPFEMYGKRKEKEDDEDSGFRSRLNSVTQSSPGSSVFSNEGASPHRKISDEQNQLFQDGFGGSGGYVPPLFGDFEPNEFTDNSLLLDQQRSSTIWGH